MLSGDHRQLAPIVAHNWEEEDRYPVTVYQPYVSAYEAVRGIKVRRQVADDQVVLSSLTFTFRLPEVIWFEEGGRWLALWWATMPTIFEGCALARGHGIEAEGSQSEDNYSDAGCRRALLARCRANRERKRVGCRTGIRGVLC